MRWRKWHVILCSNFELRVKVRYLPQSELAPILSTSSLNSYALNHFWVGLSAPFPGLCQCIFSECYIINLSRSFFRFGWRLVQRSEIKTSESGQDRIQCGGYKKNEMKWDWVKIAWRVVKSDSNFRFMRHTCKYSQVLLLNNSSIHGT